MTPKPVSKLALAVVAVMAASSAMALSPPPGVKILGTQVPSVVDDGGISGPEDVLVVVNTNDPMSVQLGTSYMAMRKIPASNLVRVALPVKIEITPADWAPVEKQLLSINRGKALALAWSIPYRVGPNQSITSAATLGYDSTTKFTTTCTMTRTSPLAQSAQLVNQTTLKSLRPSMLLASYTSYNRAVAWNAAGRWQDPRNAQADVYLKGILDTIQHGVAADGTNPTAATGYMITTSDGIRSARNSAFSAAASRWAGRLNAQWLQHIANDMLINKSDILIHATGLGSPDPRGYVNGLPTLTYLPGAEGDTLTSYAGRLYDTYGQGSALDWLRAGATASYGTVREPCNFAYKFTNPATLGAYYTHGDTLVESMWKSVQWQDEGLFIGEPLARPFDKIISDVRQGMLYAYNYGYMEGSYSVWQPDPSGSPTPSVQYVQLPAGKWVLVGPASPDTQHAIHYVLEKPSGVLSGYVNSTGKTLMLYPAREKPAVGF